MASNKLAFSASTPFSITLTNLARDAEVTSTGAAAELRQRLGEHMARWFAAHKVPPEQLRHGPLTPAAGCRFRRYGPH